LRSLLPTAKLSNDASAVYSATLPIASAYSSTSTYGASAASSRFSTTAYGNPANSTSTTRSRYLNLASPELTQALEAPLQTNPSPTQDSNPSAAAGADERNGNPYFTLPHPVVYKLRTCCLDDFIPITADVDPDDFFDSMNVDGSTYYTTRKLELPDTGVAYLFRGILLFLTAPRSKVSTR
jgi:hypothetical protein